LRIRYFAAVVSKLRFWRRAPASPSANRYFCMQFPVSKRLFFGAGKKNLAADIASRGKLVTM
jgi:hypothetical protein